MGQKHGFSLRDSALVLKLNLDTQLYGEFVYRYSTSPCHGEKTGSTPVFTANAAWMAISTTDGLKFYVNFRCGVI